MPIIGLPNREQVMATVADAFDQVLASITGFLYTEHKDDGTHENITADSLTLRPTPAASTGPPIDLGPVGTYPNYVIRVDHGSVPRVTFGWVPLTHPTPFGSAAPTYINGSAVVQGGLITVDQGNGNGGDITSGGSVRAATKFLEPDHADGVGYWTDYTPTWTGSGGNPSIGNGTLTGSYSRVGDTVSFKIQLVIGSTTTLGTGTWHFTLPVTGTFVHRAMGAAGLLDSGTGYQTGMAYLSAAGTCSAVFHGDTDLLRATGPVAWATGDNVYIEGSYQAA